VLTLILLRKYVLILILLIIGYGGFTQDSFNAGFFFGANGIQFQGDTDNFWTSTNGSVWGNGGLSAGVYVDRCFWKNSGLKLELRYIRKGSIYEYVNNYNSLSFEIVKLLYTEIPLLYYYQYSTTKRKIRFESGVAIARLFASKVNFDELLPRIDTPDPNNYRNMDVSWIGAIKFPVRLLRKDKLLFGIRYSHSLFSIHKDYKLRNMDYGLELNYSF